MPRTITYERSQLKHDPRKGLTPVPCDCYPPVKHGPHWVKREHAPGRVRELTAKLSKLKEKLDA